MSETQLASLRAVVDEADWGESGWTDQPTHTFGIIEDGVLMAVFNAPPRLPVVVHPSGDPLTKRLGKFHNCHGLMH